MRKRRRHKKSLARIITGWLFFIMMLVAVVFIGVHIAARSTTVSGNSMYPVLADGDKVILDTVSYHFFDVRRFDCVIFSMPHRENMYSVKRVVGLPGESVQIMDGRLYVNGNLLSGRDMTQQSFSPGLASAQITLGENEYFVLGDNGADSSDSREPTIGNIPSESIIGKVVCRIWPLDRIGWIK